jgi:hypothetical protein
MQHSWLSALLLGVLAHGDAVGGEPARHPGLRPGEAFTYRLSVGPIEGARARMSIGMPVQTNGHQLVAVQGEAETVSLVSLVAPVNAVYTLVLDAQALLPREVTTVERGLKERRFHSRLDGRALDLEVVSPQRTTKMKRTLPTEARDPLSAFFALRASALRDGEHVELDVIDGAALWRTQLRVVGRETIRLNEDRGEGVAPSAPQRAIKVEGTLQRIDDAGNPAPRGVPKRTLVAWISDDPTRALLRASFDSTLGRARLEMTSYLPPPRSARWSRQGPLPGLQLD